MIHQKIWNHLNSSWNLKEISSISPPFQPFIGKQSTYSSIIHRRVVDRFFSSTLLTELRPFIGIKPRNWSMIHQSESILKSETNFNYFIRKQSWKWPAIHHRVDDRFSSSSSNAAINFNWKQETTNNSPIIEMDATFQWYQLQLSHSSTWSFRFTSRTERSITGLCRIWNQWKLVSDWKYFNHFPLERSPQPRDADWLAHFQQAINKIGNRPADERQTAS